MPDQRPPAPAAGYAELRCRTNFSFLEGASHPDELVRRAAEQGYAALAVTDRNSLAGVVRAHVAAKEVGLKLLVGAEVAPVDAAPVLVWATDRAAYGRLARLLTVGRRAAPKGECHLTLNDVAAYAEGLLAGVPLRSARVEDLHRYRAIFGDRCYAIAELHHGPDDRRLLQQMVRQAREARLPLAAANDVHYHVPARRPLQDVLTAIRHGCPVSELGDRIFPNAERYLKPPALLAELFAAAPHALARTVEVADRCTFSLDELRYEYPEELCPPGKTPLEHLTNLVEEGLPRRYPHGVPERARQLVNHELALIGELRYEAYFLTVWDLVRFARSRDILCQGRGSAANSVVCFCLGITEVDPERIDVLFERFISKERNEPPDIDVDFEHERREEVLQYVYDKYGRERAGMTAEVISYRLRSAIRDTGKALGLSEDRVDALAKAVDHHHYGEARSADGLQQTELAADSDAAGQLLALARELLGFPRHLSQHVGGMVITHGPLCEMVPIENAAMADRTVVQWNKDDLDALGILKVDCLALGMLTAIHRCFDLVKLNTGRLLTLANVPREDKAVYQMMCEADTVGVFQIESRAQMSMLPRLQPRCFYDLVIEVAIVRPGPIQGKMVHPFLRRRANPEELDYPSDAVRQVLQKTLGVPIFQEQVMKLVVVAANFTPGEADELRRAMAAWRRKGTISPFRDKLLSGMAANGYPAEFAERLFQQIQGFSDYGFPESHAASFALLAYISAWLKRYYPAAFTAALLNSQPMGFYAPAQLVADARGHGVAVRPVDVNFSDWDCTLEGPALRLGLRMVAGLARGPADAVVAGRAGGPFTSVNDLARRAGLRSGVLRTLARADVFGSLRVGRRAALWQALPSRDPVPLFDGVEVEEPPTELPPAEPLQEVLDDYSTTGLTLRQHPVTFLRSRFDQLGVVPASQLETLVGGYHLKVAGLVLMRQRPGSANGITFMTLEDETGIVNLIVRLPVWERYRCIARTATVLLAQGELQREGSVIHVLPTRFEDFSQALQDLRSPSRDFR